MKKSKTVEINESTIAEAYKTLGVSIETIKKGEDLDDIEDDDDPEDDDKKDKDKKNDKMTTQMSKAEIQSQITAKEAELSQLKESLSKSEEGAPMVNEAFQKGLEELSLSIKSGFESVGTLVKGLSDQLNSTKEELQKAQEQIEELQNQPVGRKSITGTKFIDKDFNKGENIEEDGNVLSMSANRNEIQNILLEKSGLNEIEKGGKVDSFWNQELQYFEANGYLTKGAVDRLLKSDKVQIVR